MELYGDQLEYAPDLSLLNLKPITELSPRKREKLKKYDFMSPDGHKRGYIPPKDADLSFIFGPRPPPVPAPVVMVGIQPQQPTGDDQLEEMADLSTADYNSQPLENEGSLNGEDTAMEKNEPMPVSRKRSADAHDDEPQSKRATPEPAAAITPRKRAASPAEDDPTPKIAKLDTPEPVEDEPMVTSTPATPVPPVTTPPPTPVATPPPTPVATPPPTPVAVRSPPIDVQANATAARRRRIVRKVRILASINIKTTYLDRRPPVHRRREAGGN